MEDLDREIIERMQEATINCPECESMDSDEQYTCTTCWYEGGDGTISIFRFLQEHPKLLKKE